MTHEEVIGNSMLFLLAAFDTTATTLSFLIYYLAINPDVQKKLFDEILKTVGNKVESM